MPDLADKDWKDLSARADGLTGPKPATRKFRNEPTFWRNQQKQQQGYLAPDQRHAADLALY